MHKELSLLVLAGALVLAQADTQRFDEQVSAYAAAGRFNGVAAVARDGKILFAQGYGMANFEWNIPNAPDTKFRLGSITKQFTGMAMLLLEREGKLKVDDPVCRHVPDCPEAWQPITLHHLLAHTSGIPSFTGFPGYVKSMPMPSPPGETIGRFRGRPLNFPPGSKFEYSNSGYVLLGWVIERAGGVSYEEYLRKNVFEPLGMADTGYDWSATVLPRRAAGYSRDSRGLRNADYLDMSIPHAAGSLYSTALDLVKWDAALRAGKLLTPGEYQRYFQPVLNDYAYGSVYRTVSGVRMNGHGGGINGFSTMIRKRPVNPSCAAG
jgi:CubicO group peptidase (beta-lactamase class C family)